MDRTLNNKALATALGLGENSLSMYALRPGFPHELRDGARFHNAAEVRAWLDANGLGKRRAVPSGAASPADAGKPSGRPAPKPLASDTDPFILTLLSGTASSVEIANVGLQLAARKLANQAISGDVLAADFKALNEATEEMRKSKEQAIEQAVREGQLIERATCMEIIGTCAGRLVQVGSNTCTAFALQCEIWDGDPDFLALSIEDRKRKRMEWATAQFSAIRALESSDIERQLNDSVSQAPVTVGDEVKES